ncbi:hypothetical protein [Campylobacter majalis]|uniref:hypothetical protein n=1 Tax=Campylobacter majalis TaxID=2790656 RepID=UPI001E2E935F|nr:hypothetical protein [Campylobacter majalis]
MAEILSYTDCYDEDGKKYEILKQNIKAIGSKNVYDFNVVEWWETGWGRKYRI